MIIARLAGIHEKEIGSLPAMLPPLADFSWSAADVFSLLPSAFGLAFAARSTYWSRHERWNTCALGTPA